MDIELHLLIISEKSENESKAQSSMSFVYETYRKFVYNLILKKIHFTQNKEETALKVMSDVFLQVWKDPLKWEYDSSKHKTQEDGFKSYLSVVSQLKFFEELRKNQSFRENELNTIDEPDSEWKWSLLDKELDYLDEELAKRRNLIDECLSTFSDKKQDIIRMYFMLYDDNKNMKKDDIYLLESMFDTTWQNIRQIISRAKKDIKIAIQKKL